MNVSPLNYVSLPFGRMIERTIPIQPEKGMKA
jgi:hypothetical protein